MSRRTWRWGPLSLVDRWFHCNSCGKKEEMCEETSAGVVSISCGLVCGGTYVWLDGVLSGVLAACVVVCAVRAVVTRSVFCSVGVPCVGSLVHRYAPWCKISKFHLHLVRLHHMPPAATLSHSPQHRCYL